jgi:hypothetical protein
LGEEQERLKGLWSVLQRLPPNNHTHLAYLVKFLNLLTSHQGQNKMSAANVSIVIAPNLLWPKGSGSGVNADDLGGGGGGPDGSQMGLGMTMTHLYSSVLDTLLTYTDYFFPEGETKKRFRTFLKCSKVYSVPKF